MATVTLEAYDVMACSDYPASSCTFAALSLEDGGTVVTPTWESNVIYSDCSENVSCEGFAECTISY